MPDTYRTWCQEDLVARKCLTRGTLFKKKITQGECWGKLQVTKCYWPHGTLGLGTGGAAHAQEPARGTAGPRSQAVGELSSEESLKLQKLDTEEVMWAAGARGT